MNKIIAVFLSCIIISPAWAGSSTVNYNSTGSSPFATTTDGSGNNVGRQTIWDYSAAANGAAVNSSHQLSISVDGPPASLPLPTGAATATLQSTINTTLGSPFQAGGSIGNTSFIATQATSSNLKAQVDPLTAASWGIGTSTQNSATASNGQLALGQFNTTPTTITTGNMSPLQMDSAGNLLVNIKAGAGSGGTAIVDNAAFTLGTTSETPIGCYNGSATTTAAHVGIVSCTSTGAINVQSIGLSQGATAAGTTMGAVGGQAVNAEETALTNGQISRIITDLVGRQINFPFANKENLVQGTALATASTSPVSLIGVPGSSLFIYITHVSCTNSGVTGTTVTFENGSGGSTQYENYAAANGGGFVVDFPTPIGGVNNMTANTALYFQAGSSTSSLICNAAGFKGT